jgi:hypothetical protein
MNAVVREQHPFEGGLGTDAAEMMVLEAVLENVGYNRAPNGGTGYQSVYAVCGENGDSHLLLPLPLRWIRIRGKMGTATYYYRYHYDGFE